MSSVSPIMDINKLLSPAAPPPQALQGVLLVEPVGQFCGWNQEAVERACVLCPDPATRASVVHRLFHSSTAAARQKGCLLEQAWLS